MSQLAALSQAIRRLKVPNLAKGAAWIGALQFVRVVLSLAGMALLLRRFAPAEYGLVAIGTAAAELSMACLIYVPVAIQVFAVRLVAEGDDRALATVLWCAYALRLVSSITVSAALFALAGPLGDFYQHPELALIIAAVSLTALGRAVDGPVETNFMYVEKRYGAIFLLGVLEGAGLFAVNLAALAGHWTVSQYALGYALSWMPRNIYCWFLLYRFAKHRSLAIDRGIARHWMRRIIQFTGWHSGMTFLNSAAANGGTLVIGRALGPEATAIYSVAVTLLRRLIALVFSPDTIFVSRISQAAMVSARHVMERVVAYYSVFGLFAALCAIGMLAYAPEIASILGGERYRGSVVILQILTIVVCIRSVEIARHISYAGERTRQLFWVVLMRTCLEYALLGVAAWTGSLGWAIFSVVLGAAASSIGIVLVAARGMKDSLTGKFVSTLSVNMIACGGVVGMGVLLAQFVPEPWRAVDLAARTLLALILTAAMAGIFWWTYTRRRRPFLQPAGTAHESLQSAPASVAK